jgi:hypothetical protein
MVLPDYCQYRRRLIDLAAMMLRVELQSLGEGAVPHPTPD